MKCLRRLLLSLCVFACVLVFTQDTTTTQYLNIRSKLIELKKESEFVTEQLRNVSENLTISQQKAKEWEETSRTLSESLTYINQQYNDCYEQLVIEKTKNRNLTKILVSLIIVLVILILLKIVFMILYFKGIPMSRFIDILV